MECAFKLGELFSKSYERIDASHELFKSSRNERFLSKQKKFAGILDEFGSYSQKQQSLPSVVTSYKKLGGSNHTVYLILDFKKNEVVGLLKVGNKKLFLYDEVGHLNEYLPLCILDFCVHEKYQRQGRGTLLMNFMLQDRQAPIESLTIDSPSQKMLGFMAKNYNLFEPLRQANNFIVYREFFKLVQPVINNKRRISN